MNGTIYSRLFLIALLSNAIVYADELVLSHPIVPSKMQKIKDAAKIGAGIVLISSSLVNIFASTWMIKKAFVVANNYPKLQSFIKNEFTKEDSIIAKDYSISQQEALWNAMHVRNVHLLYLVTLSVLGIVEGTYRLKKGYDWVHKKFAWSDVAKITGMVVLTIIAMASPAYALSALVKPIDCFCTAALCFDNYLK